MVPRKYLTFWSVYYSSYDGQVSSRFRAPLLFVVIWEFNVPGRNKLSNSNGNRILVDNAGRRRKWLQEEEKQKSNGRRLQILPPVQLVLNYTCFHLPILITSLANTRKLQYYSIDYSSSFFNTLIRFYIKPIISIIDHFLNENFSINYIKKTVF